MVLYHLLVRLHATSQALHSPSPQRFLRRTKATFKLHCDYYCVPPLCCVCFSMVRNIKGVVLMSPGWQPRWFVLDSGILSYYDSQDDVCKGSKGSIKMSVCEIKGKIVAQLNVRST